MTFSDLLVSSFTTGGAEGGANLPIDQVSLNFAKIEYEYTERKPDGSFGTSIRVGWDVKANKSL
jgi:type VI secretion system secreted protein Hcp